MNNMDSLRTQIIEAMQQHQYKTYCGASSQELFDAAIMPVLDAAMKSGELLLHRATTPQKPVNESIVAWLEQCCHIVATIHPQESTVSKRELLSIIYKLESSGNIALADARRCSAETASMAIGKLLDKK